MSSEPNSLVLTRRSNERKQTPQASAESAPLAGLLPLLVPASPAHANNSIKIYDLLKYVSNLHPWALRKSVVALEIDFLSSS